MSGSPHSAGAIDEHGLSYTVEVSRAVLAMLADLPRVVSRAVERTIQRLTSLPQMQLTVDPVLGGTWRYVTERHEGLLWRIALLVVVTADRLLVNVTQIVVNPVH